MEMFAWKPGGIFKGLGLNFYQFVLNESSDTVDAYMLGGQIVPTFDPQTTEGWGNIKIFAYDGPQRPLPTAPDPQYAIHPKARPVVETSLANRFRFPSGTHAIVLTDDYNPIDFYDVWLKEGVRRAVVQSTDWDVLIRSN